MSNDMTAKELLESMAQEYRRKVVELRAERKLLETLATRIGIELESLELEGVDDTGAQKPLTMKSDQFFGMSQTGATAAYLKMKGKPATMEDILAALKAGGIEINGKDPRMTLYTQILRATKSFVKLPSGEIALLEWYPNVHFNRTRRKGGRKPANATATNGSTTKPTDDQPEGLEDGLEDDGLEDDDGDEEADEEAEEDETPKTAPPVDPPKKNADAKPDATRKEAKKAK
jgi:hypothetical protein